VKVDQIDPALSFATSPIRERLMNGLRKLVKRFSLKPVEGPMQQLRFGGFP
jgi:hypothetical protein